MEINVNDGYSKMEVDFVRSNFKEEWSHIEQEGVKSILTKKLFEDYIINPDSNADIFFGLVWTSTGTFPALHVANTEITIDGYELNAFLIRENNQLIAQCFDLSEDGSPEVYFEVR